MVVSQVYAGGGNSGATFANDFVELFNRGTTSIDLGSWSIQYASATGTSWQPTPLAGSVPAGGYYLIQLASAAAIGGPLPSPDATGTTNLANTGGKIALVRSTNALTCGGAVGSCSADPLVAELESRGYRIVAVPTVGTRVLEVEWPDLKQMDWIVLSSAVAVEVLPEHSDGTDPYAGIDGNVALRAALGGLPPRQRAAVVLRHWVGLDVAEVADLLGCSAGTVRSQTRSTGQATRAVPSRRPASSRTAAWSS
jgi:hypothetical protein